MAGRTSFCDDTSRRRPPQPEVGQLLELVAGELPPPAAIPPWKPAAPRGPSLAGSAREQFATVILARVSAGTWQRLAPIVDPAPKCSAHPGRVHVLQDGDAHPTQVPLMTDAEAADWLTATAAGEN
ncbi:hypothetical protein [Streptomyces swartbergensis]|uniref:hypothetical protein n=1 Tax=Streptomyces swartbergensis TaxID=487165 RepID=UPI00118037EB|nr:hypothetical protein [Streptomyces swartbergensis]